MNKEPLDKKYIAKNDGAKKTAGVDKAEGRPAFRMIMT
jgi:hypothetical protein